jgi:hypothetical protein
MFAGRGAETFHPVEISILANCINKIVARCTGMW